MAENTVWDIYIGSPDSLGGRVLRRQVTREKGFYRCWEPGGDEAARGKDEETQQGLLLPFLEMTQESAERFLPKIALALQKARNFDRVVLLFREPVAEALELMQRHQEKGLKVTAVCGRKGELYGGELPEEAFGPVEELIDALRERMASDSPRKRLPLPYSEKEQMPLTYAGDLASAALYVLRHDKEQTPLLVEGVPFTYGEIALTAAETAGFGGRLQFGKGKWPKDKSSREGFRVMQGHALFPLQVALAFLTRARRRGGALRLSACVIMRDNEEDIGRCLTSLKAADEIIVVDTGSVDKSIEIAREYTDKIYHFDWIDDFAAAKNFALSKATGDWITFPDSDEFFTEETAGNIHRVVEDYDWILRPMALSVRHANVDLNLERMGNEGAALRFLSGDIKYVGAIHEYPVCQTPGEKYLVLDVPRDMLLMFHTGYAPERMAAKTQRNMEMLDREKQAGHEVPLYHYYKARGLFAAGDYQAAREEILEQYRSEERPGALEAEIYRLWYRTSLYLGDKEAMEEARAAMERDMPLLPDSYALKGTALWNEGREEEAAPLLLKSLELSLRFLEDNPTEIDQVGDDMPKVAEELMAFYDKQGDREKLELVARIRKRLTEG